MNTLVFKSDEWATAIVSQMRKDVASGISHILLPAGASAQPVFQIFRSFSQLDFEYFAHVKWYSIDDVNQIFEKFFRDELPKNFLQNFSLASQINVEHFDYAHASAYLGVGLNGHVAFHEPEFLNSEFLNSCVKLEASTYKNLGITDSPWAFTLGLGFFKKLRYLRVLMRGTSKREIWNDLKNSKALPITRLKTHSNIVFFLSSEVV